jgi:hypothetical protein
MGEKKVAHTQDVGCREGDFGEEIVGRATGNLLKFDALTAVHREARTADAEASIVARRETEKLAVEVRRGMKVGRVQADVGDAGNGWVRLRDGGDAGVKEAKEGNEIKKPKVSSKAQGERRKDHGFS